MAKYPEYKQVSYPNIAKDVLKFWEDEKIFEKSVTEREGAQTFTFYEGPPSANGTPGIHHVMARTVKDIFCRFKTQKGFQVKRKGGWDTHGLPVELQVEKELGIKKDDIGKKISVADYNQKCKQAVMKFKDEWDQLTQQMGYWVDLDDPYITFDQKYMETLWHLLKKLYDKGLLYKGYTIQPYSPAAGTGLSSHELNQPGTYQDVKDTTVVAQFKIEKNDESAALFDADDEDVRLLAWTTTPWTLPSNTALAVGENITYVKVKTYNQYTHQPVSVILAKDLVGKYFSDKAKDVALADYKAGDKLIPFEVVKEMKGAELVGVRFEQLMPYVQPEGDAFRVIPGDYVSTEDGTGIVHIAPTFGADDKRVADLAGIPPLVVKDEQGYDMPLVNKKGQFVDEVTDFAGRFVKEEYYDDDTRADKDFKPTDVLIAIQLKEANKAFKVEKYEHSYPHCWRTDKPVLYYPLDSWFIKTTALKDRLVELNKTINWKPASTGTGRFGNWLENLVDWNLSRSRFWGTPLPIWVTKDRKEEKCIGSLAELKEEVKKSIAAGHMTEEIGDDFDLHRPYVDDVILTSSTGEPMYREPDLIDVWFDSGAMPYAQWHYPFENEDIFNANYPADFIAEGVDQTRGWFFTLHAIATLLYDKVAFKNVIANGLVLDKNGNKMSKRLGNAINPFETMDKYGPDATRWYMIANANPWDNLKFDLEGVAEVQRKFFGTLSNTYSFFALYANLDGFDFSKGALPMDKRTESDRWVISRLNSLIKEVDAAFDEYEPTKAARAIQNFVSDELSNWYVRLNRKRFWVGEYNEDKEAAYQTLYTALATVAQLAAPIAPFYAERLFQDLNGVSGLDSNVSVHLADFPVADDALIDEELEKRMHLAQSASSLVHSLRKKEKIKVRQPLQKVLIPILNEADKARIDQVAELIISETNVKEVEYIDDASGILVKKIKPNFRKLGQTYGPKMKQLAPLINQLGQEQIKELERTGQYALELDGETITLGLDDVEITSEDIPGWLVASEDGLTVALDITITDELRQEGISRDVVNRLQNLRKDQGLEVQDKIAVSYYATDELLKAAIAAHKGYIQKETQALSLELASDANGGTSLDIDGLELTVSISIAN
ncbi:isoleucine--tRNA ligase [Marinoscillum furvescens]|uniref:Isoleucine--tRNA ligase n=1 Tax=Marinoscillum furvescens DSM 4134 TaxID=1122208 RepID=A0A3D9KXW3_MARFU|nr:isoleucine--tRNA ligase [Marinoscillum furvescens]RED91639.1 isoleucyl-tRNA synthetase [Marinoscillum furvescens DSM 4134]